MGWVNFQWEKWVNFRWEFSREKMDGMLWNVLPFQGVYHKVKLLKRHWIT